MVAKTKRLAKGTPLKSATSDILTSFPIVAIGASAGGLEACRNLIDALPARIGMAFILVQHLDPTHESMMVDLLASHTAMKVQQASDGMVITPDHLYIIPPGHYLEVRDGALYLSEPLERHGARLPFDFTLKSLAQECGARTICVILSGTGSDGSVGLKAVKTQGGLVIVQEPTEASYDGMPRSAMLTGHVDLVLPVADMPAAFIKHDTRQAQSTREPVSGDAIPDWLPKIIDLLRAATAHDFTLYKPGTLQRRIERRMAMVSLRATHTERYIDMLHNDPHELDLLSKDLLINVTSFFRDERVFDYLAQKIIPDMVRTHAKDRPLRIWIAGCSTGEETYSLAMLFSEQLAKVKRTIKLQIFASDVDTDAVAIAREGYYPGSIKNEITPERLAHFFTKKDDGYKIAPELRELVVFTVQDVLSDPPFSRLDMVSCRNLLIYLRPDAQVKVIAMFHFALRDNGILLLGSSETIAGASGRFELISKPERLYRHLGRGRLGGLGFAVGISNTRRAGARAYPLSAPSRQVGLADLCRRLMIENFAPAAVLINHNNECLFASGPTDKYLGMAPGHATHDVLAMARRGLLTKLRAAITKTIQLNARTVVTGARVGQQDGSAVSFSIDARPVTYDGEALLLISFIDSVVDESKQSRPVAPQDLSRVTELEYELVAVRTELQTALHNLEVSGEEQNAINEEALSVNEEYQSTNEELLTSKEELQSLNEELTALNAQLQETVERQRTTSDDLQNILYSTDVATLFLDKSLNIRFFTPATKSLFNVIPGDVGRPLADLNSLSADKLLAIDARDVLKNHNPLDREIETGSGVWFLRRIMPYLAHGDKVEGVVITFTDITDRKRIRKALEDAKQEAELATVSKSRFLAAASHDLRQPLQTLALLQSMLAKLVDGPRAQKLITQVDDTLGAMSGMLNTMLDINQIEAGVVRANMTSFPINDLLNHMRDQFSYHAQANRLVLRVVPCGLFVHSDLRLLEQMIRNLLSNALKYTKEGRVLLGCRRRGDMLSIEIWDTGIGIPDTELQAIFEEYHQINNVARERSRGLGLGLAIVQRLEKLLGHTVRVRSHLGKGSVFSIEVKLPLTDSETARPTEAIENKRSPVPATPSSGTILIIEDDADVRELLELLLKEEGYTVVIASDGMAAISLTTASKLRPDLILADYNLPNGMNGLDVTAKLRQKLNHHIPVIILTGDISSETLRSIAEQRSVHLNKPVKLEELTAAIKRIIITKDGHRTLPAVHLAKAPNGAAK